MNLTEIKTLKELKRADYRTKSIKEEIRDNLIAKVKAKEELFTGIIGYDTTVLPDIKRALLAKHNILLLGLRGQAKTRIARSMVDLLDEYIPYVAGSEINDDPFNPISRFAKDLIEEKGDETPISWLHRSERFVEKLATPDVTVADLIGDIDPIKAATLKLAYSDERVVHYGLLPRANRSIFVINELPDLQARIQVGLFNILQEGDVQIRGYKMRLPLDIQFVFTANPEDYTNRGSIVTPLKDRIDSQILTHYPQSLEEAKAITAQEARHLNGRGEVIVPDAVLNIIERVGFIARESDMVDEKSGVSARMAISAFENIMSSVELRMLANDEKESIVRVSDIYAMIPAITGKIELVYEGEQEGPYQVALDLIGEAIKQEFTQYISNPSKTIDEDSQFQVLRKWFSTGNIVEMENDDSNGEYERKLNDVPGLNEIIFDYIDNPTHVHFWKEFVLHALAELNVLNKEMWDGHLNFNDLLANMLDDLDD
ncbi:sigma 54-interacting transcriptional regulator [Membranihabitans maritimus]|uniref:sigma 54-interacting transcriptional regulator n=1 Tax=Membranihabitans maritimus TaxID=2904244 RepID=UPI001F015487|nr:sigma 54-interacting transcriptional regulator [Membranihabitans maritimus]